MAFGLPDFLHFQDVSDLRWHHAIALPGPGFENNWNSRAAVRGRADRRDAGERLLLFEAVTREPGACGLRVVTATDGAEMVMAQNATLDRKASSRNPLKSS